jgi:hypothetical protein
VPFPVRPTDYQSASFVLTQQGAFFKEFDVFGRGLTQVGKSIDLVRGNLGRLWVEVRQADQNHPNGAPIGNP